MWITMKKLCEKSHALKMRLSGGASTFARESTIHGLKEFNETNVWVKGAWGILFMLCLIGMSYQLYQLVENYLDEPTASRVTLVPITNLPGIMWCPAMWISEDKIRNQGVSANVLSFLLSHIIVDGSSNTNRPKDISNVPEVKSFLMQHNWSDIDTFINNIKLDTSSVVLAPNLTVASINTIFGPCYVHNFTKWIESLLSDNPYALTYMSDTFVYNQPTFSLSYLLGNNALNTLFISNQAKSIVPYDGVKLMTSHDYYIKLEAVHVHQMNTQRTPCSAADMASGYDSSACSYLCFAKIENLEDPCQLYIPGEPNNVRNVSAACSATDGLKNDTLRDSQEQNNCFKQCPIACKRWMYKLYTQDIGTNVEGSNSKITIAFINPMASQLIEETPLNTLETVAGGVGGIVSLWCGASIISLAQIIYYCGLKRVAHEEEMHSREPPKEKSSIMSKF